MCVGTDMVMTAILEAVWRGIWRRVTAADVSKDVVPSSSGSMIPRKCVQEDDPKDIPETSALIRHGVTFQKTWNSLFSWSNAHRVVFVI